MADMNIRYREYDTDDPPRFNEWVKVQTETAHPNASSAGSMSVASGMGGAGAGKRSAPLWAMIALPAVAGIVAVPFFLHIRSSSPTVTPPEHPRTFAGGKASGQHTLPPSPAKTVGAALHSDGKTLNHNSSNDVTDESGVHSSNSSEWAVDQVSIRQLNRLEDGKHTYKVRVKLNISAHEDAIKVIVQSGHDEVATIVFPKNKDDITVTITPPHNIQQILAFVENGVDHGKSYDVSPPKPIISKSDTSDEHRSDATNTNRENQRQAARSLGRQTQTQRDLARANARVKQTEEALASERERRKQAEDDARQAREAKVTPEVTATPGTYGPPAPVIGTSTHKPSQADDKTDKKAGSKGKGADNKNTRSDLGEAGSKIETPAKPTSDAEAKPQAPNDKKKGNPIKPDDNKGKGG